MLVRGYGGFFTWIVGIALVIAAVIFLLPPAISAFENAIIAAVAVGFIVNGLAVGGNWLARGLELWSVLQRCHAVGSVTDGGHNVLGNRLQALR